MLLRGIEAVATTCKKKAVATFFLPWFSQYVQLAFPVAAKVEDIPQMGEWPIGTRAENSRNSGRKTFSSSK